LKTWCEERSDKKLYELQTEACEWMVSELSKPDLNLKVDSGDIRLWVGLINYEADDLRKSKKAVKFKGFSADEYSPYSSKSAKYAGSEKPKN
jgi:hypothetical protein